MDWLNGTDAGLFDLIQFGKEFTGEQFPCCNESNNVLHWFSVMEIHSAHFVLKSAFINLDL